MQSNFLRGGVPNTGSSAGGVSSMNSSGISGDYDDSGSESSEEYVQDKKLSPTELLMRESVIHPEVLIGWIVDVKGRGRGLIIDLKKSFGRTTQYVVEFDDCNTKLLRLKRSEKKGNIPFIPVKKVN